MKTLVVQNLTVGQLNYIVEQGQWGLFQILINGTNATGQNFDFSKANFVARWNGKDFINADLAFLYHLSNVYGGYVPMTNAQGGAVKLAVFIPSGLWFDSKNVYDIGSEDKVEFQITWDASKVASGSIAILGKRKNGMMSYLHGIFKRTLNVIQGDNFDNIEIENITNYYLKLSAYPGVSEIALIQIQRDGKTIVDCSGDGLLNYSNWIHLLESSNINLIAVDFIETKDVRDAIGKNLSVKITSNYSGSWALNTYYSVLIPRADKIDISLARSIS